MKYTVKSRVLHEGSSPISYYTIELWSENFSEKLGNVSQEIITIIRSAKDGQEMTVGSVHELQSVG